MDVENIFEKVFKRKAHFAVKYLLVTSVTSILTPSEMFTALYQRHLHVLLKCPMVTWTASTNWIHGFSLEV